MRENSDLAKKDYWDLNWRQAALPRRIHPFKNPIEGKFSRFFRTYVPAGGRFLEVGCGGSAWMSFFAESCGSELWGVDYSEPGLKLTQDNLAMQGHQAHLVLGDFLKAELPENGFRTILSIGVIEHYTDPSPLFRRAMELLEPGGVLVTIIPNMAGVSGRIQKAVDRAVYDVHIPFLPIDLDGFHAQMGFEAVVRGRPFGIFYLGVVNWRSTFARLPGLLRLLFAYTIQTIDRVVGWSFFCVSRALDSEMISPYFLSVYRKPR